MHTCAQLLALSAAFLATLLAGCAAPTARTDAGMLSQQAAPVAASRTPITALLQGHWAGTMHLDQPGGGSQEFWMELIVKPIEADGKMPDPAAPKAGDRFTWTIIYARAKDSAEGRQERPYELVVVDPAKGRYDIDEKSSIVIPMTHLGPALASTFSVGETRLIATYELGETAIDGEPSATLDVRIFTHPDTPGDATGGKDGVPEVKVWVPGSLQRARMAKLRAEAAK